MKTHPANEKIPTGWRMALALFALAALLVGPITVVATLANPPPHGVVVAAAAPDTGPPALGAPIYSMPADSGDPGAFAFGYVEFDWDPRAPGGVPGFDSWPPGSPSRR